MKKLLFMGMIASCVAIAGCGNSEVESRVYEQRRGVITHWGCTDAIEKISSRKGKYENIWIVKIYFECRGNKCAEEFEYSFRDGKLRCLTEYGRDVEP